MDQWVPHELNKKQVMKGLEIWASLTLRNKTLSFLKRIITCEVKRMLYDNRKRSGQWLDTDERLKLMPQTPLYSKKTMITVWWCNKGIIHYSFLQPGTTLPSDSYCRDIDIMHERLCNKEPALTNRLSKINGPRE